MNEDQSTDPVMTGQDLKIGNTFYVIFVLFLWPYLPWKSRNKWRKSHWNVEEGERALYLKTFSHKCQILCLDWWRKQKKREKDSCEWRNKGNGKIALNLVGKRENKGIEK